MVRFQRVLAALGGILKIYSISILVPLMATFVWDENITLVRIPGLGVELNATSVVFLLFFALVLFLGFVFQFYGAREMDELREREGFIIVGLAWLMLAALGSIPFLLLRTTSNPLDAFFEAMSGITTTGATVLNFPLEKYPASVMLWRAVLQYLGGIGIIVLSVAIIGRLTEGGHKLIAMEAPGGSVQRLTPKITQTAKALSLIYLTLSAVVFTTYLLLMKSSALGLTWRLATYEALLHTFTTLSTGGFSNHTNSFAAFDSAALAGFATLFMLVAGGSFPLYWAFAVGQRRRLVGSGELKFYFAVFIGATFLIFVSLANQGYNPVGAVSHAAFQAASFLTTTGYTSTDHNAWPDSARLVLFLLMFTGGMAGSTAGGIKIFRIQLLMKLTRRELQKLLHPHAVATVKSEGRILPEPYIRRVVVFFFSYITLFIAGAFVYMYLGMDLVSGLSTSASALGNIGPGLGTTAASFGDLHEIGRMVAILQMWLGRLEIFTVLLLFVPATYRD